VDALLRAGLAIEFDGVGTTMLSLDVSAEDLSGGVSMTVLPLFVLAASLSDGVKVTVLSLATVAASLAGGVSGTAVAEDAVLEASSSASMIEPPMLLS